MGDGGDLQIGDGLEVLAIECWEILEIEREQEDWETNGDDWGV